MSPVNPMIPALLAMAGTGDSSPPYSLDTLFKRPRSHRFSGETGVPTHKEIRERRKAERNRKRDARRKNRR